MSRNQNEKNRIHQPVNISRDDEMSTAPIPNIVNRSTPPQLCQSPSRAKCWAFEASCRQPWKNSEELH